MLSKKSSFGCRAQGPKKLTEVVKVLALARASNASIMLTHFASLKEELHHWA